MIVLFKELWEKFPEIRNLIEGGEEDSYDLFIFLASWLAEVGIHGFPPELIQRVVAFTRWCEALPPGESAGDDPYTILVVGFYETLFNSNVTLVLLPSIISKDQLVANSKYLKIWVGQERYEQALALYT